MDKIENEGERDAEARLRQRMKNNGCPHCGGEVEIGGLYSPGRGNSRVYFANGEGTDEESSRLPVFAGVCRECGLITLMTNRSDSGQED